MEEVKLKYNQLSVFIYYEGCDYSETTDQKALLGNSSTFSKDHVQII